MSTLPISRLLNQYIGIAHATTPESDFYHEKSYSSFTNAPARVEIAPGRTFGQNGEELSTYATIYTTAEVNVMDKIAMPDGSVRQVLSASRQVGRDGKFSHMEVRV